MGLAGELKRSGTSVLEAHRCGRFAVESVDFNAIYAENLAAMAEISGLLGRTGEVTRYAEAADAVATAIREKMWDEAEGMFWDLAGEDEELLKPPTSAGFVTMFGAVANPSQAERLVAHLRTRFASTYPVATTPPEDPCFDGDSYWRGSTWLNVNYLIAQGLRRYGFSSIADEIGHASLALVSRSGFREHYNPLTGSGGGSLSHTWSGIVLDLDPSRFS